MCEGGWQARILMALMKSFRKYPHRKYSPVIGILLLSLVLRWALIFKGGQYYFPDESRYQKSLDIAVSILAGGYEQALSFATNGIAHLGFELLGIIPALIESFFRLPSVTPALLFSFFSILSLYLIWKIALRIGMSDGEAQFALFVAACSHSLLYFSRHLLPYDTALFFGLLALYFGLSGKPTLKTFLFSGGLSFLCFATYIGYWAFAGFTLVFPTLFHAGKKLSFFQRAFFTFMGFISPVILLAVLMSAISSVNIFRDYFDFAQTVAQGSYSEGWILPFEYFWYAEYTLMLFLVSFCLYAMINASRDNLKDFVTGISGVIFIYLCFAIPSTLLHSFVVYGRLSRQLIPFLVLASTQGFFMLLKKTRYPKQIVVIVVIVLCTQAIINYHRSYEIIYPREFIKKVQEHRPSFRMSLKRTNPGAPAICKYKDLIITNAKYIYPLPETLPDIHDTALMYTPHPINFLPYQYEGHTPEERQILRSANINIELYQVDADENFELLEEIKSCIAAKP